MKYDIVITDAKHGRKLWLKKGGPFCLECGNYDCDMEPSDIGHIIMRKPTLFKKGAILLEDKNENALIFTTDKGGEINSYIEVSRKEADNFYMAFSIFQDMGFDITAL